MKVNPRRGLTGLLAVFGMISACAPPPPGPPGTPPPAGSVTVVAAGDIACSPADKNFNGGLGDPTHCQMKATADEVGALQPAAVLPLGDLQYVAATQADFLGSYDLSWGRFKAITRPVVGNHEYITAGAAGYRAYFGAAAAPAGTTWYSFDLGSWHIVALDANCNKIGGCGSGSPEQRWLAGDLASNTAACTLAMWHQPAFSSSVPGDVPGSLPLWQAVVAGGADLVLNGHRHQYERFAAMGAAGTASATGAREIVVGTGGDDLEAFGAVKATSEARVQAFGCSSCSSHRPATRSASWASTAWSSIKAAAPATPHRDQPGREVIRDIARGTPHVGQWPAPRYCQLSCSR